MSNVIKDTLIMVLQLLGTGILMTLALVSAFIVVPYMMITHRKQLRAMCSGKPYICSEEI